MDNLKVAYHDSCCLGRYNDIFREPRAVLDAIKGIDRMELSRHGTKGFCCGGGGGHMWMEEPPDKRPNMRRTDEVIQTKVNAVATTCPYCLSMFEDGLKAREVEESIKAMDLSELVARALHALGPRSAQPFVTVACHAIDPVLGEADLFGRAAPSPEHEPQRGLLELADGGTVFLDEVSVLTPAIQARLARLLEARRLQRVAGVGEIDSDLHIVGATTRDLSLAVAAGRFRSDLYYHLAVVEILLPPLRDRREDIPYHRGRKRNI